MLATRSFRESRAEADHIAPPLLAAGEIVDAADDDSDDLAPARGLTLGAVLGMVSIAVVGLLGWWLL